MFLAGLWHGASWNFVLWGLLHGVFLVIEHLLKQWKQIMLPVFLTSLLVFTIVSLLWIPFRSTDLQESILIFGQLFNTGNMGLGAMSIQQYGAVAVIILTLCYQYWRRDIYLADLMYRIPYALQAALLSVAMLAIALSSTGDTHAFIYFQF